MSEHHHSGRAADAAVIDHRALRQADHYLPESRKVRTHFDAVEDA